jgi:hypothetical protein
MHLLKPIEQLGKQTAIEANKYYTKEELNEIYCKEISTVLHERVSLDTTRAKEYKGNTSSHERIERYGYAFKNLFTR